MTGLGSVERRVTAALWSLQGIGRQALDRLGQLGPLEQWHSAEPSHLMKAVAWSPRACESLRSIRSLGHVAERLEQRLVKLGYEVAFNGDPKYPPRVSELAQAPPMLFVMGPGAAVAPRRRVAMVGTRHPDQGFLERARFFAEVTSAACVGIISGGADGVDQACHGAALRAGAETWAFLGCAIDQIDAAQRRLVKPFREHGGTLFSEFPPGARSARDTFPRRNRLISGAADAVLVLRAPRGSGALHTVSYAIEQGRPVLAMPGDFFNEAAAGCNELIRSGRASICLEPNDLLRAAGLTPAEAVTPVEAKLHVGELTPLAQQVLANVQRTPVDFEWLLTETKCGSGDLASALLELELANRVVKHPGRRYELL